MNAMDMFVDKIADRECVHPGNLLKNMEHDTNDETDSLDKIFSKMNNELCAKCKQCCCGKCAHNIGHYSTNNGIMGRNNISIYSLIAIKEICRKYGFDSQKGFLTNTGCAIPRGLRSVVCLGYNCEKMKIDNKYGEIRKIIDIIRAKRIMHGYPV